MLRKLVDNLKSMGVNRISFNPETLNDSVALRTSWSPLKGGGSNFKTHSFVEAGPNRVEFKASIGAKFFYLFFTLIGFGALVCFLYFLLFGGGVGEEIVMPGLLGCIFSGVGIVLFYFGTAPVVFDKTNGFFWKGRRLPDAFAEQNSMKHCSSLDQIYALQLISEYCHGAKRSYYSYELNLVLRDGRRINVVDHGNRKVLREDAESLSRFLGRPVWDAI